MIAPCDPISASRTATSRTRQEPGGMMLLQEPQPPECSSRRGGPKDSTVDRSRSKGINQRARDDLHSHTHPDSSPKRTEGRGEAEAHSAECTFKMHSDLCLQHKNAALHGIRINTRSRGINNAKNCLPHTADTDRHSSHTCVHVPNGQPANTTAATNIHIRGSQPLLRTLQPHACVCLKTWK